MVTDLENDEKINTIVRSEHTSMIVRTGHAKVLKIMKRSTKGRNIRAVFAFVGPASQHIEHNKELRLKKKFNRLKSVWLRDTMFTSNISEVTNHPAYIGIIGLGKDVIPLILNELKKSPGYWFSALSQLTGENPIKEDHMGVTKLMKSDWLNWAEKKLLL